MRKTPLNGTRHYTQTSLRKSSFFMSCWLNRTANILKCIFTLPSQCITISISVAYKTAFRQGNSLKSVFNKHVSQKSELGKHILYFFKNTPFQLPATVYQQKDLKTIQPNKLPLQLCLAPIQSSSCCVVLKQKTL